MAAGALSGLVAALETHRGRDRAVRALWLWLPAGGRSAGGPQASPSGLPGSLLAVSAQLSACRTALRLFDDFAMLRHSCGYGLGPKVSAGGEPTGRTPVTPTPAPPQEPSCMSPSPPHPRGSPQDEDGLVRGAVGALQRGQPAVLPLRARGVGSRAGIIRTSRSEVVDPEHGALGSGPAPGHPAVRWDEGGRRWAGNEAYPTQGVSGHSWNTPWAQVWSLLCNRKIVDRLEKGPQR
uniref:Uncharacterized protein n=1 Tax=Strigops habroptila TaxID=2489341 RepID=A0A672V4P4_STRHB